MTSGGAGALSGAPATGGGMTEPTAGTAAAPGNAGTGTGGTAASGGVAGGAPEPAGGAGDGGGGAGPVEPEPVCGNGIIESGEQCDDADHAGQDGCAECQVQCSHFGSGTLKSEDNHCYRGYDQATFEAARAACDERGAHLVTIGTAAENELVRELVATSKLIGGFEDVSLMVEGEGTYGWVTGEPFTFTNWAQSEPDQQGVLCGGWGYERCYAHCIGMNGQGRWQDLRCDLPDGYVCEWEPAESAK
jgi:cysteine-rich repeat protein